MEGAQNFITTVNPLSQTPGRKYKGEATRMLWFS